MHNFNTFIDESRPERSLHGSILEFNNEDELSLNNKDSNSKLKNKNKNINLNDKEEEEELPERVLNETRYCLEEGEIDTMLKFDREMLYLEVKCS